MGKQWKQWLTYFGGSKITADSDCCSEIKRHLHVGRKVTTNLDSILKSRDITLLTKVCTVKAMMFLVVVYRCDMNHKEGWCELDHKEGWVPNNWCFWIVVLEKTLENSFAYKKIKSVNPKEINPEYSLEGRLLSCSCNDLATWFEKQVHWKRPWCWERSKVKGEESDGGWGG